MAQQKLIEYIMRTQNKIKENQLSIHSIKKYKNKNIKIIGNEVLILQIKNNIDISYTQINFFICMIVKCYKN